MQSAAIPAPAVVLSVVLSVVLAVGAAAAVAYTIRPDAPLVDAPAGADLDARIVARVVALEREIGALRQASAGRPVVERRPVDPVTAAQIEAAVASYFAAHPAGAGAGAAGAAAPGGKKDLGQTFLHLQGDLTEEQYTAVWKELRASGQIDAMVGMFESHAANNPNDPGVQTELGVAYLMQLQGMPPSIETGKIAMKADKVFDQALKLDPNHWQARLVKAQALSFWPPMFGKQAEAIANLETLRGQQEAGARQEPRFARTYLMLGNLYSQQGKQDEAMEAWRKGATLFPDHAELSRKIGSK